MKVQVIEDEEKAGKLREKIRENGNVCPAANSTCMCIEFLVNCPAGRSCAFGLYKKVEE